MKRTWIAVMAFLCGALLGVTAAMADSPWTEWSDAAGDANGGVDITAVKLMSDRGTLLVDVTAAGLDAIDPASQPAVTVLLDIDRSASTGSPSGNELALDFWEDAHAKWWWDVYRWSGRDWQELPQSWSVWGMADGQGFAWQVTEDDVPGMSAFNLYVISTILDAASQTSRIVDRAPDGGVWSYEMTSATTPTPMPVVVKPVIGAPVITPLAAAAGKRMTVTFPITRSDNGRPMTAGRMTCVPSVAGKVVAHTESFAAGKARLSFVVPKTAKGKLLKIKITIEAGSSSATRIASLRVK